MAVKKSQLQLIEVCTVMISQSGALVLREPEQVVSKVVPAAKAFIDEFGSDATLAVRCLGHLVGNIFYGTAPVEHFFTYPRRMLALLRDGESEEEAKEDPKEVIKPTDPVLNPSDPAAVKAAGELQANPEAGEFGVSALEIADSIKEKLFNNGIGSTSQVEEAHLTVGFPFLSADERKSLLIAFARKTGKEVIVD